MKQQRYACALLIAVALVSVSHAEKLAAAQAPAAQVASAAPTAAAAAASEESGLAAVYSNRLAGHTTASGKRYNPMQLTAAHKTLPFGTHIRVTNEKNGKSVELRVTDRGPRQAKRILDISPRAARALGISRRGMAEVKLTVL